MARVSILLIMVALIAGMVGCGPAPTPARYNLTMAVTPTGSGTATDLTNASPYVAGAAVSIKATADSGYQFVNWTAPAGTFADASAAQTTFTMPAQQVTVTANFLQGQLIRNWHDLHAIRDNPGDNYLLMNDLDSTAAGYTERASPTANGGKGWQPIGTSVDPFTGTFDGQGYEIGDLFINRPGEDYVGLFGSAVGGVIENVEVMDADVTGYDYVGGLVGLNEGNVSNSHAEGDVTGDWEVGGLVGENGGDVTDSYAAGSVIGGEDSYRVGGLVGYNYYGDVSNSYATGNVTGGTGGIWTGGLAGGNYYATVSNCYATGTVTGGTGGNWTGGLLGGARGCTVSDSYATGTVIGDVGVGGLVGGTDQTTTVSNCYATGMVTGVNWTGGLVGVAANITVSNCYATGMVTGVNWTGGLVGVAVNTIVSNSYSSGSVTGYQWVGGLVGFNYAHGTVSDSHSTGSVTGGLDVGGLVGDNDGTVSNSFWDIETSGQATSAGGTGKTTAEMMDFDTFSGAGWNIIVVANPGTRNLSYIWNIVNGVTYPFLSWRPV